VRLTLAARLLAWAAALCGGLLFLLFLAQRRLLYFPSREEPSRTARAASRLGLAPWLDAQGQLIGWKSPALGGAGGRLLVLHGNAGSALDRTYLRDAFQAPAVSPGLDVFLLEYPGYGPRAGAPSERSLVGAAVEAIDLLRREPPAPLVIVGESLGSAVAALAAVERPGSVNALLLVTPLASVPAVARRHYPFFPAFLLRDTFHADRALPRYCGRVAFLVAGRDEVVFTDLGESLFRAFPGSKRLWIDEAASHNTVNYDPSLRRWSEMATFLLSPL
jgi:pimeloyl-ACP methyl ester carboxylesterase